MVHTVIKLGLSVALMNSSAAAFVTTSSKRSPGASRTKLDYSSDHAASTDAASMYDSSSTASPFATGHAAAEAVDAYSWAEKEALDNFENFYSTEAFEDFYMARKAAIEQAYPLTEYYKQEEKRRSIEDSPSLVSFKAIKTWLRTAEAINGRMAMGACAVVAIRELIDPSMRMSVMMAEAGIPDPTNFFS